MDEAVDIVLGGGLDNALDTVDVDISVGEVPGIGSIDRFSTPYDRSCTHLVGYWRPTRL